MLDFEDIQGYILSGYAHQIYSRFLFCEIVDPERAVAWIDRVIPEVTTARERDPAEPKPEVGVNLAFAACGLRQLGLDSDTLGTFPRQFSGGADYDADANPMTAGPSAKILGDVGDCAPEHWDFGGPNTRRTDLVLLLFATNEQLLDDVTLRIGEPGADNGLLITYRQDSNREGRKEAFGFTDGISQPAIEGSYVPVKPGQDVVKTGEFIIGYVDEYGLITPPPSVAADADPNAVLPPAKDDPSRRDLGTNGTYLAIRKLQQDVDAFWDFCTESTRAPDGSPDDERKIWLASKMIGRWPSGAPMALSPDHDDIALGDNPDRNNDFLYGDDPYGLKCPMGSHLRRGNPRDDLPPDNEKKSAEITKRHRIIRRGRPYNDHPGGKEAGLMFMAVNADIERQFEFVQQTWIDSPKFGHMYDNKDPILSDPQMLDPIPGSSGKSVMTVPAEPVRYRFHGLKRFVVPRGGGYYFLPSMRALRFLGKLDGRGTGSGAAGATITGSGSNKENRMSTLNELWGRALAVGGKFEHTLHEDFRNLRELLDDRLEFLAGDPKLVRPLFRFLREHHPIFATQKVGVVSLYDDVIEVLGNGECFNSADIYGPMMRLTTGDFVLGMDETARYRQWMGWMRRAVHPSDIGRVSQLGREIAEHEVAAAGGRIDFVARLGRHIPTRIVGDYYGAPGPDETTNERWMRQIFRVIFFNMLTHDPVAKDKGIASGKELHAYLASVITERKTQLAAGQELPDDFLSRLVRIQADDAALTDEIINELVGGTIVGTTPTNNKAITQALEQLLERPEALALARQAALAGDEALLTHYIFEALRFDPQNPFLPRHCLKDCVVAAGTDRETEFKAGSLVIVGTESAMFDENKFREPDQFLATRPLEDYLHFGHGQHTCFGKHIATALWPAMLAPLLVQENLARADGEAGKIEYDGAFPTHWTLTYDVS